MTKNFSLSSLVAGTMLGALLAGAWFLSDNLSTFMPMQSSLRPTTSTDNSVQESGAISIADQPFGTTVIVESVTVSSPGVWIAVREVNMNDLGNVLGAARAGGPRSQVPVSLLRATEPDRRYAVQLYRDDNNGIFDPSVNSVYVDFDTGARVVAYFTTTE